MKKPYITFDNGYIETCWWIMKRLGERGLVYQGYKVTPHCPRCETSLSSHEVALGYKDDTDDPHRSMKAQGRWNDLEVQEDEGEESEDAMEVGIVKVEDARSDCPESRKRGEHQRRCAPFRDVDARSARNIEDAGHDQ